MLKRVRECINIAVLERSLTVCLSRVLNVLMTLKLATSPLELSLSQVWWHMPVISATHVTKAGEVPSSSPASAI